MGPSENVITQVKDHTVITAVCGNTFYQFKQDTASFILQSGAFGLECEQMKGHLQNNK